MRYTSSTTLPLRLDHLSTFDCSTSFTLKSIKRPCPRLFVMLHEQLVARMKLRRMTV